jgi:hypothetical protein
MRDRSWTPSHKRTSSVPLRSALAAAPSLLDGVVDFRVGFPACCNIFVTL